jgi:hypothetical protein
VETERRERNVRLLDTGRPDTNTFHVSEEVAYSNGIHRIRPDVVFLVNGIPLLQVETKAATRLEGIAEALERSWFSSTRPRRYWGRPASSPTSARKPWSGWPGRTSRTQ